MGLEIPDGATHPVKWTMDFYKKRGMSLQPNVEAQIVSAWEAYVQSIRTATAQTESKKKTNEAEASMPPNDSSWFSGFTVGRKKNGEEDQNEDNS